MPTPTYTLLDSVTLASSASSVTFSSIDQSYGDLVLVVEVKSTGASDADVRVRFNGDSTSGNYKIVRAWADAAASSTTYSLPFLIGTPGTQTEASVNIYQIMDYSATDKHKSVLQRSGAPSDEVSMAASRWTDTSAITSIEILEPGSDDFAAGGTFALYGIAS